MADLTVNLQQFDSGHKNNRLRSNENRTQIVLFIWLHCNKGRIPRDTFHWCRGKLQFLIYLAHVINQNSMYKIFCYVKRVINKKRLH